MIEIYQVYPDYNGMMKLAENLHRYAQTALGATENFLDLRSPNAIIKNETVAYYGTVSFGKFI